MSGYPVLQVPAGARFIAVGAAGAVFEDSNGVIKIPITHNLTGCSESTIKTMQHISYISDLCITREKLIYQTLPKNPNILDCVDITEQGLHFPYYRFGDLRTYLRDNKPSEDIRQKWIKNAIDAITFIHSHGVVHCDISPRNFLVADDLSIKLCDFAGSVISDMEAYVEEEDRYRLAPWTPRSFKTDLFALGCLIYELSGGTRPYDEIEDVKEVARLYASQNFPNLDGFKYQDLIYKSWTSAYTTVDMLREDYYRIENPDTVSAGLASSLLWKPVVASVFGAICFGSVVFWAPEAGFEMIEFCLLYARASCLELSALCSSRLTCFSIRASVYGTSSRRAFLS
ncbi:uncharacterized protein N7518_009451 [Penicillium psychrosexuale]|uniref:uncharacterized protein n=1 Tax=Penicillium psychrosexuale TaxID=1002107 RepID=UPI002545A831|nr:uncharacterized protein N7518_009451 [Penicillium psychrosexuale]KAJ5783774.1 hypothetical protein N7518_009451 [Penicillium psychrosexuale]